MTKSALLRATWIAVCVSSAGCGGGDGPTAPISATGSMSFSYSGATSGSFGVSGPIGALTPSDGATAVKYGAPFDFTVIFGVKLRSSTRADFLDITLPTVTAPGVFSLSDADCASLDTMCPVASFALNALIEPPFYDASVADDEYLFTAGNVTVTSVTASRIVGTFAGSASTYGTVGAPKVITITNGTFDVPIKSPGFF